MVFKDPGGWLIGPTPPERGLVGQAFQFIGVLPDPSTEHLIKRVIGMPGDRVVCCDSGGRHHGQRRSRWTRPAISSPIATACRCAPSSIPFEVLVPAGHVFVMGDHRDRSSDSRCHLNDAGAGRDQG